MIDEFEHEQEEGPKGLPGWMATFADMMALLMCFFVLLLAFSEMDAQKFKRIAGAMKEAFGVQNEISVEDPPKGTSAVLDQFSPGTPEPTSIEQIEQATVDSSQQDLLRLEQERLAKEAEQAALHKQEEQSIVRDGFARIINGENPKAIHEFLQSYVHEKKRRPHLTQTRLESTTQSSSENS